VSKAAADAAAALAPDAAPRDARLRKFDARRVCGHGEPLAVWGPLSAVAAAGDGGGGGGRESWVLELRGADGFRPYDPAALPIAIVAVDGAAAGTRVAAPDLAAAATVADLRRRVAGLLPNATALAVGPAAGAAAALLADDAAALGDALRPPPADGGDVLVYAGADAAALAAHVDALPAPPVVARVVASSDDSDSSDDDGMPGLADSDMPALAIVENDAAGGFSIF